MDWEEDISREMERDRLHVAAQKGDLALVRHLIAEGLPVNAFDEIDKTPLHYAAMEGHLDVMKALLDAGADVNAHVERRAGNTPLGEVVDNCPYEVAKLLVDFGADPSIPGWMGLTARDNAGARLGPEGLRVRALLGVQTTGSRSRSDREP